MESLALSRHLPWLGMVAKACKPNYLGGRKIRRIVVRVQPGQKVCKTPSQPMARHGGAYLSSPAICGSTNRRITVQANLGIKWDPISKITKAKSTGNMTQVVEDLPDKCKAWSSTPSTIGKKKKQLNCNIGVSQFLNKRWKSKGEKWSDEIKS
jgi:hypothetical protein